MSCFTLEAADGPPSFEDHAGGESFGVDAQVVLAPAVLELPVRELPAHADPEAKMTRPAIRAFRRIMIFARSWPGRI